MPKLSSAAADTFQIQIKNFNSSHGGVSIRLHGYGYTYAWVWVYVCMGMGRYQRGAFLTSEPEVEKKDRKSLVEGAEDPYFDKC